MMERNSSSDCEPVSCHTAVAANQKAGKYGGGAGVETDDAGLPLPHKDLLTGSGIGPDAKRA